MITEFDLRCTTCGGPLRETTVTPDVVGFDAATPVSVAECVDCGGWHYPERTLDRLWGQVGGARETGLR